MAKSVKILGIIMAGGKGERLYPLTLERTKPSVQFAGKYRIIDFVLSNFVNSGIYSIYVLVQYKSQSLIEHIRSSWRRQGMLASHFITVVPPQMRRGGSDWYRGTADSVSQNINLILDAKPDIVAIFGGDHIYRMDIKDMVNFHLKTKSEVTVACCPFPSTEAAGFGQVDIGPDFVIKNFREKPKSNTAGGSGGEVFVSMGNYIFNTDSLISILSKDNSLCDFGRDILPRIVRERKVSAYDFSKNKLAGIKPYEKKGYWQDVGTIKHFWEANMDVLGKNPLLDLNNESWPIYSSSLNCPPARVDESSIENSLISEGCIIEKASIKNSILGRAVKVEPMAVIEDSIIMDFTFVKQKARIKKAIVDRFNNIPAGAKIFQGGDSGLFFEDSSGIVVVKRGSRNKGFLYE